MYVTVFQVSRIPHQTTSSCAKTQILQSGTIKSVTPVHPSIFHINLTLIFRVFSSFHPVENFQWSCRSLCSDLNPMPVNIFHQPHKNSHRPSTNSQSVGWQLLHAIDRGSGDFFPRLLFRLVRRVTQAFFLHAHPLHASILPSGKSQHNEFTQCWNNTRCLVWARRSIQQLKSRMLSTSQTHWTRCTSFALLFSAAAMAMSMGLGTSV